MRLYASGTMRLCAWQAILFCLNDPDLPGVDMLSLLLMMLKHSCNFHDILDLVRLHWIYKTAGKMPDTLTCRVVNYCVSDARQVMHQHFRSPRFTPSILMRTVGRGK